MANQANTTSAFIAKLLAPLPEDVEQVDTPAYRKAIAQDFSAAWEYGDKSIDFAWHGSVRDFRGIDVARNPSAKAMMKAAAKASQKTWEREKRKQMLRPAPNKRALNWKQKHMMGFPGDLEVIEAVARDVVRLAAH